MIGGVFAFIFVGAVTASFGNGMAQDIKSRQYAREHGSLTYHDMFGRERWVDSMRKLTPEETRARFERNYEQQQALLLDQTEEKLKEIFETYRYAIGHNLSWEEYCVATNTPDQPLYQKYCNQFTKEKIKELKSHAYIYNLIKKEDKDKI